MNRRRPSNEKGSPTPPSLGDVRDDMMRDISRLLHGQNLGSIEDVNAFMQNELIGKPIPRVQPANDSERAEDIVIAASQMQSIPKLCAQVAKALALDPNCISAHLLLAETAETPAGALAHSRDAIAAGERVLSDVLSETEPIIWYHAKGRT